MTFLLKIRTSDSLRNYISTYSIAQALPLSDLDLSNLSDLPQLDIPLRSVPAASSHALSHARQLGIENLDPLKSTFSVLPRQSFPQKAPSNPVPVASAGGQPEASPASEEPTLARLVHRFRHAPPSSRETRDHVPENAFWWLHLPEMEAPAGASGVTQLTDSSECGPRAAPAPASARAPARAIAPATDPYREEDRDGAGAGEPPDELNARIERIQELLRARERSLLERCAATPSSSARAPERTTTITRTRSAAKPASAVASRTSSSSRSSRSSQSSRTRTLSRSRSASPLDPAVSLQGIDPSAAGGGAYAPADTDTDPSLASRLNEVFREEPARRPMFAGGGAFPAGILLVQCSTLIFCCLVYSD